MANVIKIQAVDNDPIVHKGIEAAKKVELFYDGEVPTAINLERRGVMAFKALRFSLRLPLGKHDTKFASFLGFSTVYKNFIPL